MPMTSYFEVQLHVPGEISEKSYIDHTYDPIKIYDLHLVFDFNPDDFCTTYPIFFLSEELLNELKTNNVSGFSNPRLIRYEYNSQSWQRDKTSKKYFMIDILSNEGDDMKLMGYRLLISEKVLEILKEYCIKHMNVVEV